MADVIAIMFVLWLMLLPYVWLILLPIIYLADVIAMVADVIATVQLWLMLLPWWLDVKSTHECW